jgi:ankyrin repeat protein
MSSLDEGALEFAHKMFDLARAGSTDQLAAYIDAGLPVNMTNDKGDTLLILAAYHDHPETVRALLERGADTARANNRGQTALSAAVFQDSEPMVIALLAAGADPAFGAPSPIDVATLFERPDMLALLGAPPF